MGNPWETIRLADYEAHMRAEGVQQLQVLSRITREQLAHDTACVAVLGAAGGNGLEHVDPDAVEAVWALYLSVPSFASLIESNRKRLGVVSCVIQRSNGAAFVSESPAAGRLGALEGLHRDVGEAELSSAMEGIGFRTVLRKAYPLPNAKELIRIDYMKKVEDMGETVKSKAWDWELGRDPVWLIPSEESHWLAARWKDAGFRSVLDLGCGLGRHSIFFSKHGFRVNATDLSPEGVRHLNEWRDREGLQISTDVCDMLHLPYADGAFDCVFAYHVISHTDTPGFLSILGQIDRVLRPGGEFFVTLCSKESWSYCGAGYPRIDDNSVLKTEGAEKDVPHFFASLDDVIALFGRFDIIKIRHTDDCWFDGQKRNSKHFFILGKKKAG